MDSSSCGQMSASRTIANYKMILSPKNPTDQFETTPTQ